MWGGRVPQCPAATDCVDSLQNCHDCNKWVGVLTWTQQSIGAFVCSWPKFLKKFWAREHTVMMKKRSWVQDGFHSDQSCPLSTLTHRLEPNYRSQFVTATDRKWKMLFGPRFSVTLLRNLADFATELHFGREKPEHANAPIPFHFWRHENWNWKQNHHNLQNKPRVTKFNTG